MGPAILCVLLSQICPYRVNSVLFVQKAFPQQGQNMFFINHFVAASNLSHHSMCLELLGGGGGKKQKERTEKNRQTTNKSKNLNRNLNFLSPGMVP